MTYEEKRELRLQISQLLADAGLNQAAIKELVEKEIKSKVERALDQTINSLNAECPSGNYIEERIKKLLDATYFSHGTAFTDAVKRELANRIIEIKLRDVEV